MVTKFTALLAITLRTISPLVKHVKEQSLQCTRYWFLGAISSLACYIHIANTYIVNHHLFACKKYLQEPPRCEYFLLRIGLCCMDAMSLFVKNSHLQEPATLCLSKSRNKVFANKSWFLQYMY